LPFVLALSCAATPNTKETVETLIRDGRRRELPRLEMKVETVATTLPPQSKEYRIGIRDVLDVRVAGQPEFGGGETRADAEAFGHHVKRDGRVYLPLVGRLEASGRTVLEVQNDLIDRMKKFLAEPQVSVDVLRYRSQKYFVLGAVGRPGAYPVDGDTTLLEGLGAAGGVREGGDIEGAYVVRGRTLLPISLGDLLLRGDTSRNVLMRDGDLVYVPAEVRREVYVLGEVRKPGKVLVSQFAPLTLAAAVAEAGGLDPVHADKDEIRVFRGSWQAPQVFTITAEDLYRYGEHIALKPGDRIHVAPRGLATWSRTMTLLLPFLQTATSGLTTAALIED
jgi:polysaccharide export outer membrane protein